MTTTKKAAKVPGPPLACHQCGSRDVKVSESQQMKAAHRDGERTRRLHADVRCGKCGWRWWSRHKTAIKLSRDADREAYTAANPGSRRETVPTDAEGDEG